MNFNGLASKTAKLLADNSPAILTAVGVVGTVSTAYLTGKATFNAAELLKEAEEHPSRRDCGPMETRTKIEMVWRLYIPPVAVGTITIVSIVFANRIGMRRAAAMAAAYSLSEKAFAEYKDKVIEKIGEYKEQQARDEVAQDQVDKDPLQGQEVFSGGVGGVLCYDSFNGRYFRSSMEEIKKAQNDTNYEILHNNYCSLGDFYSRLGLPGTAYSEEVGWNSDHLLEIAFSSVLGDNGEPCLSMNFRVIPIRSYNKIW